MEGVSFSLEHNENLLQLCHLVVFVLQRLSNRFGSFNPDMVAFQALQELVLALSTMKNVHQFCRLVVLLFHFVDILHYALVHFAVCDFKPCT